MTSTDALSSTDTPTTDHGPATTAWLLHGLASTRGTLQLTAGRLTFMGRDGRSHVDLAADGHLRVTFPRRLLGTGMRISAPGVRLRVSLTHPEGLIEPATSGTGQLSGRAAAAAWRRRFRPVAPGTSPGSGTP